MKDFIVAVVESLLFAAFLYVMAFLYCITL